MLDSAHAVLKDHIKDLYHAEKQLLKALPKMARSASTPSLQKAFEMHLKETHVHVERLEKVATLLEFKPSGKRCVGMEGLVAEGAEAMEQDGEYACIDAALIAAAQKVEHYEISAYGTARALAERLGMSKAAAILQQTLDEEKAADEKLSAISEREILPGLQPVEAE